MTESSQLRTGRIGVFSWLECVGGRPGPSLVDALRHLEPWLTGCRAVNTSWDSGLLEVSEEEAHRGWTMVDGRAVSPAIDPAVIDTWPSDDSYEEWYFFQTVPSDVNLRPYCNWEAASLADWEGIAGVPDAVHLGDQLASARPRLVLGIGARLYGISDDAGCLAALRHYCESAPTVPKA